MPSTWEAVPKRQPHRDRCSVPGQELNIDPYAVDVSELLPRSTASAPGNWEGVTVEHLLDMTTEHYRYEGQSDDYMGAFFLDYSLEGRLQAWRRPSSE